MGAYIGEPGDSRAGNAVKGCLALSIGGAVVGYAIGAR
jgi:hypothetical protein